MEHTPETCVDNKGMSSCKGEMVSAQEVEWQAPCILHHHWSLTLLFEGGYSHALGFVEQ